jgi:hypothetical protein
MLLQGSDNKSVAMIRNFKWKSTPLRALPQGSFDLTIALAKNLQAAAKLHLVHLDKLPT